MDKLLNDLEDYDYILRFKNTLEKMEQELAHLNIERENQRRILKISNPYTGSLLQSLLVMGLTEQDILEINSIYWAVDLFLTMIITRRFEIRRLARGTLTPWIGTMSVPKTKLVRTRIVAGTDEAEMLWSCNLIADSAPYAIVRPASGAGWPRAHDGPFPQTIIVR